MALCAACGQVLPAGAKFCVICGQPTVQTYQPPLPGQSLAKGRYTIQQPLSKGGMGAIYLATDHETFDRTVVIKAMLDYFDPNNPKEVQAARNHFVQEARTLSQLHHPAIPQIYTHFQDSSHNYIVMEYIQGRNLEQRLTRQNDAGKTVPGSAYPQEDVIRWGIALCKVLEYLASRQPHPVVHHDIKPANILLDSNSNDIRLVDFGTARARLMLQTGGSGVGLQKSSIFGTQGYAPPEQYRGQSEPRSDVYALAATLYHLVTDDDPSAHPFDFPRLDKLGPFGKVLKEALHREVAKRPTATLLRRKLEALLAPARPVQAPDGSDIANERELTAWCEQHWEDATRWLYRSLPDLVEHLWFKPDVAQQLRDIVSQNRNHSVGLDKALELLDPQGFALADPRIAVTHPLVDLGKLARYDTRRFPITLVNTGRRFVRLKGDYPDWISAKNTSLALIPGKSVTLHLTADVQEKKPGTKLNDYVIYHDGTTALAQAEVRVRVSRWRTLWQMPGRLLKRYGVQVAILVCLLAGWFIAWTFAPLMSDYQLHVLLLASLGGTIGGLVPGLASALSRSEGKDNRSQFLMQSGLVYGSESGVLSMLLPIVMLLVTGSSGTELIKPIVLFLTLGVLGGAFLGIASGGLVIVAGWLRAFTRKP